MINNAPPKNQPPNIHPGVGAPESFDHLPHAFQGGAHTPHDMVIHDASPNADANPFPVLKAFQDYLEMERQQARKRELTLTIFFVSLMTLVVVGFISAFIYLFGHMSRREERLVDEVLQQRKEAVPPAPVLADLAAQQATRAFQAVALNLQTNLGSQLALVGTTATNLNSKVDAQSQEMTKLRETLAELQKENASIRAELPKLAQEASRKASTPVNTHSSTTTSRPAAPAVAATPAATAAATPSTATPVNALSSPRPAVTTPAAITANESAPAAAPATARSPGTATPATPTAGTAAASTGKPLAGYDETVLSIRSHGGDNNIPWRTFVPN